MRLNFRIKIMGFTFFFMVARTQALEGVTSKVEGNKHLIFFDLEKYPLDKVAWKLRQIQTEFSLGDIYITSDAPLSYRAWCFSRRTFLEYIHILIHTFPYLDFGFFIWTVRRTGATLRTSSKKNRESQRVVMMLKGYEETTIPEKLVKVIYDTGIEKQGYVMQFG